VRPQPSVWIASALAGVLSVPAVYALLRAYDVAFRTEPNPARIVWSPHIAMFWRLAVGAYVAGMVATLAFIAARRDVARTTRALSIAVIVVGAMSLAQGLAMP